MGDTGHPSPRHRQEKIPGQWFAQGKCTRNPPSDTFPPTSCRKLEGSSPLHTEKGSWFFLGFFPISHIFYHTSIGMTRLFIAICTIMARKIHRAPLKFLENFHEFPKCRFSPPLHLDKVITKCKGKAGLFWQTVAPHSSPGWRLLSFTTSSRFPVPFVEHFCPLLLLK